MEGATFDSGSFMYQLNWILTRFTMSLCRDSRLVRDRFPEVLY